MSSTRQGGVVSFLILCIVSFAGTEGVEPRPQMPCPIMTPSCTAYGYPCITLSYAYKVFAIQKHMHYARLLVFTHAHARYFTIYLIVTSFVHTQ